MQLVSPTTYRADLTGGDSIFVGGKGLVEFRPRLELERWGGECGLGLELPELAGVAPRRFVDQDANEKLLLVGDKLELHVYALKPKALSELGGAEFAIVLKERPKSNTLALPISLAGLRAFYQAPISAEDAAAGITQEPSAVGGYALYHATRGRVHRSWADAEKYRCGKAMFVFPPVAYDAGGQSAPGQLSLDGDRLLVSFDAVWLAAAKYPVLIDPTFGYTTLGTAANSARMDNNTICENGTSGAAGTATSMTLGLRGHTGSVNVAGSLYAYVSATEGGSKLGTTNTVSDTNEADHWQECTFASGPAIGASTNYWLAAMAAGFAGQIKGDGGDASELSYKGSQAWPTWPDPLGTGSTGTYFWSLYCTYTESGGGASIMNQFQGPNLGSDLFNGGLM